MKNLYEILSSMEIEIPEEKKAALDKELQANYKTLADYEKQAGKLAQALDKLKAAEEGLKAFEGVDVADLKDQVGKLQEDLAKKDSDYAAKLADMEFDRLLEGAVSSAKGRSKKAILGELGAEALESLKASKNQAADIEAALEGLKKDSGYLFEDGKAPPPYAGGTGSKPLLGGDTSKMNYTELCAYLASNPGATI